MCSKVNPDDSEENFKFAILEFLNEIGYKNRYTINSKSKIDLVIRKNNQPESPVGVIIEVKSLKNSSEMISIDNPNKKAFHELILYYLREKHENSATQIRHLIITNLFEWFIFDARKFENILDKDLQKNSKQFLEDELSIHKTQQFYQEIASPYLQKNSETLDVTYFKLDQNNLNQVQLSHETPKNLKHLVHLYKIFSPEHLLQLPFANDSNTLDKKFYAELLHIIGIEEVTKGGKKIIQRPPKKRRHLASLLEDTIIQLESLDKLSVLKDAKQYGVNEEEQIYNVALELCVTWINRLLFLKLLEAQLISFHPDNKKFRFLNKEIIDDYDDINTLFFQVLAVKLSNRNEDVKDRFNYLPYLNSTLFSPTELEQSIIFISNLSNDKELQLHTSTVLKDLKGKRRKGVMETLSYLFQFLDAYDFSNQGSEEIHEEHKTLISPAVLGLIFEKINGYKEGSFYTPGYITMFLARETIHKAVLQKFNQQKRWNCLDLIELRNNIPKNTDSLIEANQIINSLKVCDPAVGSGHFLVSVLNEIIYLKHDLGVLMDSSGRLLNNYDITLENDELMITDPNQDGAFFHYNPKSKESQRVQETLFQEKKTIIENCLFGVDINPNSVNICRLRLWIELLKYTFYKADGQLETLPNIDINIKCGHSLISRFRIDDNLKNAFKDRKLKYNLQDYRQAVSEYKKTASKSKKREIIQIIQEVKNNFKNSLNNQYNDRFKLAQRYLKTEIERQKNYEKLGMKITAEDKETLKILKAKEKKALLKKDELMNNNFASLNAFEWRFEFPEVLNDKADFVGFDIVIGNPPYIKEKANKSAFEGLHSHPIYKGKMDLWYFFGWLGLELAKKETGHIAYIADQKWITNFGASKFRNYILDQGKFVNYVNFGDFKVFENADIQTMIYIMKASTDNLNYTFPYSKLLEKKLESKEVKLFLEKSKDDRFDSYDVTIAKNELYDGFIQFNKKDINTVLNAISEKGMFYFNPSEVKCGIDVHQDYVNRDSLSTLGSSFSLGDGIFNLKNNEYSDLNLTPKEKELVKPFYTSHELKKYVGNPVNKSWIIYTSSKFKDRNSMDEYPTLKSHLDKFQSVITSNNKPYGLHCARQEKIFNGKKILSLRKCTKPTFTFADFPTYVSQSYYVIQTDRLNLKFLTCLLNSKLIEFWLRYSGKMQGSNFQIDKQPLLEIPIRIPPKIEIYEKFYDSISCSIVEFNKLKSEVLYSIYSRLEIEIPIKELEHFEFNNYEQLIQILETKYKVHLNQDKFKWRENINSNLRKIDIHKTKIRTIEKEIDNEILLLYGLKDSIHETTINQITS